MLRINKKTPDLSSVCVCWGWRGGRKKTKHLHPTHYTMMVLVVSRDQHYGQVTPFNCSQKIWYSQLSGLFCARQGQVRYFWGKDLMWLRGARGQSAFCGSSAYLLGSCSTGGRSSCRGQRSFCWLDSSRGEREEKAEACGQDWPVIHKTLQS